jgi:hypothetical protein
MTDVSSDFDRKKAVSEMSSAWRKMKATGEQQYWSDVHDKLTEEYKSALEAYIAAGGVYKPPRSWKKKGGSKRAAYGDFSDEEDDIEEEGGGEQYGEGGEGHNGGGDNEGEEGEDDVAMLFDE